MAENEDNLATRKLKAEIRKIRLETFGLRRQNGRIGRLLQYTAIFSAIAAFITTTSAFVGLWLGVSRYLSDLDKDRNIRIKELEDRNENLFRTNVRQLLLFSKEQSTTIPMVTFLLQDLSNITRDSKDKQDQVTLSLVNTIKSLDCDFKANRNIEFDVTAYNSWKEYRSYLKSDPKSNLAILDKYKIEFEKLHKGNEKFIEEIKVVNGDLLFPSGAIYQNIPDEVYDKFEFLFYGFHYHVSIIRQAPVQNIELDEALCALFSTTHNPSISKYIFDIDDSTLQKKFQNCP